MKGRGPATHSRRWFLLSLPAVCAAAQSLEKAPAGKGRIFPSAIARFPDPATDLPVLRLTDPACTSLLPPSYARAISRRTSFLLYGSNSTGRFEAFRMDPQSGESRQLTESADLDPVSLTMLAGDREFCYFDENRVMLANLRNLKTREVYRIPDGFERGRGLSVSEDGHYAAVVEKKAARHRLQLIHMSTGGATKLVECDEEIRDPIPRPRRASVLYRRAGGAWLVNYGGQRNYRLRTAPGECGPALWSPEGRTVLYLNFPEDRHKLHNIRELTPGANQDQAIADTTQFIDFSCNADATVFVGASGSKASPYVLLLVRAVKREMTLAMHRARDPKIVAPVFAPNSQHVFFGSDQHGKPAIYAISVEKLVEETGN